MIGKTALLPLDVLVRDLSALAHLIHTELLLFFTVTECLFFCLRRKRFFSEHLDRPPDPPCRSHVLFLPQMRFSTSRVRAPRTPCQDSTRDPPCDRSHTACWLTFPKPAWSLRVPFFQNCALLHAPYARSRSDTVPAPPSFWTRSLPVVSKPIR